MISEQIDTILVKKDIARLSACTQYLTNIFHYSDHSLIRFQLTNVDKLCLDSICKCIVQLAYLIYASYVFDIDIWLQQQPCFKMKNPRQSLFDVCLRFFLDKEIDLKCLHIRPGDHERFIRINPYKQLENINQTTIDIIREIINKVLIFFNKKQPSQSNNYKQLSDFLQQYDKNIAPLIRHSPETKLIKFLQSFQLFYNYSDLIKYSKCSFLQKCTKDKNQQATYQITDYYKKKLYQMKSFPSSLISYSRIIDDTLMYFMQMKILYIQKSSTRDYKEAQGLAIGYLDVIQQNDQKVQQYRCKFYSLEQGLHKKQSSYTIYPQLQSKRIHYCVNYNYQKRKLIIRIITNLQEALDTIDIMSYYMHNIYFQDQSISLQSYQTVTNTVSGYRLKKYLTFRGVYMLDYKQHPIIPFFTMLQVLLAHYLIYFPFFVKKPQQYMHKEIAELNSRVKHLKKIALKKAKKVYQSLFHAFLCENQE